MVLAIDIYSTCSWF